MFVLSLILLANPWLREVAGAPTPQKTPIRKFETIIRPGKLNSQFIVTNFSVLHAGGRSLFRFHISYSV